MSPKLSAKARSAALGEHFTTLFTHPMFMLRMALFLLAKRSLAAAAVMSINLWRITDVPNFAGKEIFIFERKRKGCKKAMAEAAGGDVSLHDLVEDSSPAAREKVVRSTDEQNEEIENEVFSSYFYCFKNIVF